MIARLAWTLARPGRSGAATLLLPAIAFGIVTALILTVLGGAQSFWGWRDELALFYQSLAVVALVLLLVPLVSLGGAAARLSARRRDDRLATLRLLGATTATVTALTVIESAALALLGAISGVLLALLVAPVIALIPFRGSPLGLDGVLLPAWVPAAVVAGVTLLAAVSAIAGLRRVVISPLGVRTRSDAPSLSWLRAVAAVLVLGAGVLVVSQPALFGDASVMIAAVCVAFGAVLAVLNLIGPWLIRLIARGQARRAQTPQRLLAARSILSSPKAAWRQVSGVAMTSYTAVFAGTGVALAGAAGSDGLDAQTTALFADIRTGVLITVVGSFLMVACSVGVNQAADILDRRELSRALAMLGMPLETADAARRRAVMSPLRITALGSALCAVVMVLPLAGAALVLAPLSMLVVAGVLAAGIAVVWLGLVATRPLLRGVTSVDA